MTGEGNVDPVTTGATDQDAEPSLNAPGDEGPTGRRDAEDGDPREDDATEVEDQDAEPSKNAPGE